MGVSNQVRHNLACTVTEKGYKLDVFWLKVEEEWYYPCSKNKGAGKLCSYCTTDLHLCFYIGKIVIFS